MTAATRRPRIVLVGDLLVDVWWPAVPASRNIEHAAMALLSAPGTRTITAGGVGIVADALARAGADVCLFSTIGAQPEARAAVNELDQLGVNVAGVCLDDNFITPIKTRYLNVNGHILLRHDAELPTDRHVGFDLGLLENLIKLGDVVVVSDYAKGCITSHNRAKLIELCAQYSKPIFVDTKPQIIEQYRGVTGFKLNQTETEAIAGTVVAPTPSLITATARKKLDCQLLITTHGENGVTWATPYAWDIMPVAEKYVTGNCVGAGDVFFAGFILGLFARDRFTIPQTVEHVEAAILWGIAAAGQRVSSNGLARFDVDKIRRDVENYNKQFEPSRKICSYHEFCKLAAQKRAAGKRLVFTNGCFDLMHEGHISTLTWSRKQGDALFVAVDSDKNVRQLKGSSRPVHDQITRATNVAALECVDAVYVFDEFFPEENTALRNIVREVQPAVLTKGPDYADKAIVGAESVADVLLAPLVPNKSTTHFVNKLKATQT